jgi:hypothetical protein
MPSALRTSRRIRAWALLAGAACLCAALVATLAPGSADSAPVGVVVLGQTPETPAPSCPEELSHGEPVKFCFVEGHMTGFQTRADGRDKPFEAPFEAPFEGKVVAWSITLAKLSTKKTKTTKDEVTFFNELLGSPSQARISILRAVGKTNPPKYKLVRQSPIETLNPYFGTTPIFILDHPLVVLKGQIVALSVPTWAPMFAIEISPENKWRASRQAQHCVEQKDIEDGHPQQAIGSTKTYGCSYSNARLLYTATLVKKP